MTDTRGAAPAPAELRCAAVTPREAEIRGLAAEGLSNAGVAARLFLSPRTVEALVASLLRKTGRTTRAQLVAFGARVQGTDRPLARSSCYGTA